METKYNVLFQSTPLREGRPASAVRKSRRNGFNPRPSVRGDYFVKSAQRNPGRFNPRPSVRGDPCFFQGCIKF